MVKVILREKAHFRIEIRDLKTGKTKTFSIVDHDKMTAEDIARVLIDCLNKKTSKTSKSI